MGFFRAILRDTEDRANPGSALHPMQSAPRAFSVIGCSVSLLSGFNTQRETVLRRRERAGRVVRKGAGRVVGFVEIEDDAACRVTRLGVVIKHRPLRLMSR